MPVFHPKTSTLAALALALVAPAASAQVLDPSTRLQRFHTGEATTPADFSFFTALDWTTTSFDGTFKTKSAAGPTSSTENYEATGMDTSIITPFVGVGYAYSPRLLLTAAVGPSFIKLGERTTNIKGQAFQDPTSDIRHDMSAGFAAMLGGSYELYRWSNIGVSLGGRLGYQSSSRLDKESLDTVETTTTQAATNIVRTRQINTNNASINVFSLAVNFGADWRPFNSYVTNHFGVLAGGAFGSGTLDKSTLDSTDAGGQVRETRTDRTIDASLVTSRPLGVYYGWSWFIPRFGILGVEGRFVTSTTVLGSYEYVF